MELTTKLAMILMSQIQTFIRQQSHILSTNNHLNCDTQIHAIIETKLNHFVLILQSLCLQQIISAQ